LAVVVLVVDLVALVTEAVVEVAVEAFCKPLYTYLLVHML
jgi:hypothetical protein